MKRSLFGQRFTQRSGILGLMEDLGNAMSRDRDMIMLGGGNPAHIPGVQQALRRRMEAILASPGEFERLVGNYDPPQGERRFIEALAVLLRNRYGWPVGPEHIVLSNGSQSAFFCLFNVLGGRYADGSLRRILFPMAPEYIGYADLGLEPGLFTARRPNIDHLDEHTFKYRVDFSHLQVDSGLGAICVSRPTNPTGNALTDDEVLHLMALAREHELPLIIDGAYGAPFPEIVFSDITPYWDDHVVLCLSLSKLGLPGARTGIVVAHPELIASLAGLNAILNLATGGLGAALTLDLVRSGEILDLSRKLIRPYYQERAEQALAWLREDLAGLPYAVHKAEGAIFLWLWFPDLPITSEELYQRLKQRGVLVVSGHHFFPGLEEPWRHRQECIRLTYSQRPEAVRQGIAIIAEEVRKAYA